MSILDHRYGIEAHEVYNGIYVGSLPHRDGRYGQAGIDTVVLCAREFQDYAHPDFGASVRVLHCPLDDDHKPVRDMDLRRAIATALDVGRRSLHGKKVLVTCAAGVNRSSFVAGLAIHARSGLAPDMIVKLIRNARKPPCGYVPLSNKEFVRALGGAHQYFGPTARAR